MLFPVGISLSQIQIGIKADARIMKTVFDDTDYQNRYNSDWKWGGGVGLVTQININKEISLKTEWLYLIRRTKVSKLGDNASFYRTRLNFIEVPLLLKYHFKEKSIHYYLQGGPVFDYWLGGKSTITIYDANSGFSDIEYPIAFNSVEPQNTMPILDANRLLIGLQIGGGINIPVNQYSFWMIDLKYNLMHTFLSDEMNPGRFDPDLTSNFRSTFRAVSISVGYMIDLASLRKALR
ncbi:MAG: porin family protein [Candidatus Cyclobacteriaceae bacterium M3_2C_046]